MRDSKKVSGVFLCKEQKMVEFDGDESQRLKQQGMDEAASSKFELLEIARTIAKEVAVSQGSVTADDVAMELSDRSLPQLGAAAGSLFRNGSFYWTGLRIASKQTLNHGRELKVWKLKTQEV
jgi:hypothetical protein